MEASMKEHPVRVRIGMGGWEHDELDRCFYSRPGLSPQEKLAEYSEYFDVVEVRAPFWDGNLNTDDAREWIRAVDGNKRFRFIPKLHSSFTHRKQITVGQTRNCRALFAELAHHDRLAGILIQFPYAFTNTSSHRFHLVKLAETFSGFPLHVEFRHDSWHQPSLPDFLKEHSLQAVGADLPRIKHFMPMIIGSGNRSYLRLHGRNEKGWLLNGLGARYDYQYNGREIRELSRRAGMLLQGCEEGFVICNNTTQGKSVPAAFQLAAALGDVKRLRIPDRVLEAFPHLNEIAMPVDPMQVELPLYNQAI